jgi:hypothetical protein|tara:strand:+ start:97 stop:615 length:519 start_codon:yes stop_codon:yes gene_type:complete
MIAIYLNTRVKSSNFHTIILKKSFRKKTYIMGLGYAGGRVYDEFFGQFLTNDSGEDIGKVSNSIGPYDWEKSVKISYDDETFEGVCKIDELFEQLNGVETNVRDNMFSKLKEFILYGEEAENNQSDFPVLKENSYSNLSSEIDGVYTNEFWDEEYLYITQESFWPLSLRFSD